MLRDWGLIEALEVVPRLIAVLILLTWFHREFRVERHRLTALMAVLHVLVTLLTVVAPYNRVTVTK